MGIADRDENKGRRPEPPGLVIRARRTSDSDQIAELVNLPGYRFGTNRIPYHSHGTEVRLTTILA
jgi:L-phenylalanine/L-methionine N-acetyltransferase